MTPEQEQIVLDMLCNLGMHWAYVEASTTSVTCIFCGNWQDYYLSTPAYVMEHFEHKPTCAVVLAKRLRETRQT